MTERTVPQFISAPGKIVGPGPGATVTAALPNGKEVVAFLSHALAEAGAPLPPGTQVELELTPFDFSKARITAVKNPLPSGRNPSNGL